MRPRTAEGMARHRADMEAHRPFRDFTYTLIGEDGSRVSICYQRQTHLRRRWQAFSAIAARPATSPSSRRPRRCSTSARGRWRKPTGSARSAPGATGWTTGRTVWAPELYQLLGLDPATFEPTDESIRPYFLGGDADRFRDMQKRVLRSPQDRGHRPAHPARGRHRPAIWLSSARRRSPTTRSSASSAPCRTSPSASEAERQLEQLAYSDPLTGLANRALFTRQLAALIEGCALEGRGGALLLIDLDRFKEVNDSSAMPPATIADPGGGDTAAGVGAARLHRPARRRRIRRAGGGMRPCPTPR